MNAFPHIKPSSGARVAETIMNLGGEGGVWLCWCQRVTGSTSIIVDCCRSQCLGIDFYTFNVKNIVPSTPTFPNVERSKHVNINLPILPFLKQKLCRPPVGQKVEVYVEGRMSSICPPLFEH